MKARLSEGYQPHFDIDLRYGRKGERLVLDFLTGMLGDHPGRLTVEVKTDAKYTDTQRIYIEYECFRKDGWQPSGIEDTQADYWTFVLGETVVLGIPTEIVRACYRKALEPGLRYTREEKDGSHPTRGVAIPLPHFLTWLYMELAHRARAGAA